MTTNMRLKMSVLLLLAALIFAPLTVFAENLIPATTREERLTKAIQDQQLVLDEAYRTKILQKCQNVQAALSINQDESDKAVRRRLDTYSLLQQELQAIKLRMARQGVDASEIDLLVGKLQQGLDTFTLASNAYGTAMNDVVIVDCVQKPEQFRAGIVLMRTKRALLLESAINLKSIMSNAQQTIFDQLRDRLRV